MKKKIAIMHGPMVMGGAEKALLNMLDHFDYSRYDVTLWLKDRSGALLSQINPQVRLRFWGESLGGKYRNFALGLLKKGKLLSLGYSLFYWVLFKLFKNDSSRSMRFQFRSRLVRAGEKYDAAVVYQGIVLSYLLYALALFDSPKRLAWLHGDFVVPPSEESLERHLLCYRQFDRLICVSEGVKAIQAAYYPELTDRMTVIYNLQNISAIQEAAAAPSEFPFNGTTLVTVGRLSPEKGQELIPQAARRLHDLGYSLTWYVVGDGPTRTALEAAIRQHAVEDIVILTGEQKNPYPFIKNCSLYVQPSYQEGFCVTTFEAKILQKPLVVTDVPGMREQFTEKMAYFAQPTVDSLTAAICKALNDHGQGLTYETVDEEFNLRELNKIYQLLDE